MKKQNRGTLKIIPLGGLESIGMNITAFEFEDSIIIVDCGLAFPEDDMQTRSRDMLSLTDTRTI